MTQAALLVGTTEDNWTRVVAEAVRRRGATPVVLLSDAYPEAFELGASADGLTIRADGRTWLDREVSGVYNRRFLRPRVLPEGMDARTAGLIAAECERCLRDWIDALPVFTLDPFWVTRAAANKVRQLREAPRYGLVPPAWFLGSDPDAARAFVEPLRARGAGIIVKPFTPAVVDDLAVFANRASDDDLDALDGLADCPMILQEEVTDRALEVRVTVVGSWSCGVAQGGVTTDQPDYRRVASQDQRWYEVEVPEAVRAACVAFADAFGLQYAAHDWIVTRDGRWVWLEMNPVGECFWLEEIGIPVSDRIVDVLLEPGARRAGAGFAQGHGLAR